MNTAKQSADNIEIPKIQLLKEETLTFTFFPQPEIEKPHSIENDKRYQEPFEDDGAYAD